jgi:hypothetical protein
MRRKWLRYRGEKWVESFPDRAERIYAHKRPPTHTHKIMCGLDQMWELHSTSWVMSTYLDRESQYRKIAPVNTLDT